jgi:parvulin-like peptidyl-prolyl isomerase
VLGFRSLCCRLLPGGILLFACGCGLSRDTAAEVDGRSIPAAEFAAAVRDFTAGLGPTPPALERELSRLRRGVLERLIDRELMLAEAERRRIRPSAAEVDRALATAGGGMSQEELDATLAEAGTDRGSWRRAAERDLTLGRLQADLTAAVTVDEAEINDRLALRRDLPALPEEVRASQILVRTEAEALDARRQILGGAAFADVARRVSQSPDAEHGGDLGYFARGQMPPEFDETAFTLPRGNLSSVVESPYGYHLFLVTDRRPVRSRSEADERAAVRAALLAEKRESAFRAWLAAARQHAKIRYNRALAPE